MDYRKRMIVQPNHKLRIREVDPGLTDGHATHETAEIELDRHLKRMARLQALLWAEKKRSVLIVLQALDAGGKDGTINHVFTAFNAQGTRVTGFKHPTQAEQDHDFLWRVHPHAPGKGEIAIFNRSHYEDVLFARVHGLVDKQACKRRYQHIRGFESDLAESGTCIMKFFLHISREEQLARFHARLEDPGRNWKVSESDYAEREHWDEYIKAFERALEATSVPHAPWYVIPSNHKWFRNIAIARIVADTMEGLGMSYPPPAVDLPDIRRRYHAEAMQAGA
jgi:PPK2 family polyphosphate:nucleotide phosphotransferase